MRPTLLDKAHPGQGRGRGHVRSSGGGGSRKTSWRGPPAWEQGGGEELPCLGPAQPLGTISALSIQKPLSHGVVCSQHRAGRPCQHRLALGSCQRLSTATHSFLTAAAWMHSSTYRWTNQSSGRWGPRWPLGQGVAAAHRTQTLSFLPKPLYLILLPSNADSVSSQVPSPSTWKYMPNPQCP